MDLDRGTLARIDRKVLAGLDHAEGWRMVRLPASEALWSAWRRYCSAVGISMGRAITVLMQRELRTGVDELEEMPVFLDRLESRVAERQAALDARERQLDARERRLCASQRQVTVDTSGLSAQVRVAKVGRNDPCPCGSGVKYKRCHGV